MMVFVVVAALMLAAALAFVLTPLLRGPRTVSANDTRRLLALLDESHKNGLLSDAEYARWEKAAAPVVDAWKKDVAAKGADGDKQWEQGRDHAGLRGAGVLQRQRLEDEVQAGFADGESEQVTPVSAPVLDPSAPAPRRDEDQAAEHHAAADDPHRREFGEGDLQRDERTAPQGHGPQQTTHRLGTLFRLLHARLL